MVLGEYFLDEIPVGTTRVLKTESPGIDIGVEHSPRGSEFSSEFVFELILILQL